jgi:hypothetical protein
MVFSVFIATPETVPSAVHVPLRLMRLAVSGLIASLKTRDTELGSAPKELEFGLSWETLGPVLSMVITELSEEEAERLPASSSKMPALIWTVKVPSPWQFDREISAPELEIDGTETVQLGLPVSVVRATPSPLSLSEPVKVVPPAGESLKVAEIVAVD